MRQIRLWNDWVLVVDNVNVKRVVAGKTITLVFLFSWLFWVLVGGPSQSAALISGSMVLSLTILLQRLSIFSSEALLKKIGNGSNTEALHPIASYLIIFTQVTIYTVGLSLVFLVIGALIE